MRRFSFTPAAICSLACCTYCVAISTLWCIHSAAQPASPQQQPVAGSESAAQALLPAELEAYWEQMGGETSEAFAAVWALSDAPADAVPFLMQRLRREQADDTTIASLIADLDADSAQTRQQAMRALTPLADSASLLLQRALAATNSAEVQWRLETLLRPYVGPIFATHESRQLVRGIWALEIIGTPAARTGLEDLAHLGAGSRTALLAQAALARLEPGGPPDDAPQARLRYEVTLSNTRIPLDGRLVCQVKLTNVGEIPVTVWWDDDWAYEDVFVFDITRADGSKLPPPGDTFLPAPGALEAKSYKELPPEESLTEGFELTRRLGRYAQLFFFRHPGSHTIAASFRLSAAECAAPTTGMLRAVPGGWTGRIEAEPVTFAVEGSPDVLQEGVRIRGRVVNAEGSPLAGARVEIADKQPYSGGGGSGYAQRIIDQDRTGPDGSFSFLRLPGESSAFFLTALHEQHPFAEQTVTVTPPEVEYETTITMPAGMTIRGRLVDSQDRPIPGVRIDLQGSHPKSFYSDAEGHYVIQGYPIREDIYLSWTKPGYRGPALQFTREQAAAGELASILYRESELPVFGRAIFTDGRPLQNRAITLRYVDLRSGSEQATTDSDGRFTTRRPVPDDVVVSATATTAGRRGYQEPAPLWYAAEQRLAADQNELVLTFDDRGVIVVDVRPPVPLPERMHFVIRCNLRRGGFTVQEIADKTLGRQGGQVEFRGLSPAEYTIWVRAAEIVRDKNRGSTWNASWYKELALDDATPEGLRAEISVPIPRINYGSVRAHVFQPDGRTPAEDGTKVVLRHRYQSIISATENGTALFEEIPAMRASVSASVEHMPLDRRTRRVAHSASKSGFVRPGVVTDVRLVLQETAPPSRGRVQGRLLYDDGTPVLGAAPFVNILMLNDEGEPVVAADGSFDGEVSTSFGHMLIDLDNASGWPTAGQMNIHPDSPGSGRPGSPNSGAIVPVAVTPGETITRDVIIPRPPTRSLSIDWRDEQPAALRISATVELGDVFVHMTWRKYTSGPELVSIEGVPTGPTMISIYRYERGGSMSSNGADYIGEFIVPAEPATRPIPGGMNQAGRIILRPEFPADSPTQEVAFMVKRLHSPSGGKLAAFANATGVGPWGPLPRMRSETSADSRGETEGADASQESRELTFPQLAPGTYLVESTGYTQTEPRRVEVQASQIIEVTIPVEIIDEFATDAEQ